jgi:uncharacterized protein
MPDFSVSVHPAIHDIGAQAWQQLADSGAALSGAHPFTRYEFLDALENSGSIRERFGWQAAHLAVRNASGVLTAACPMYVKHNSHGEFVFDWAWAEAYARHGLDYYPKLLCAVPYSPVTGPRLLCVNDAARSVLITALEQICSETQSSSVHVNFVAQCDRDALAAAGWLIRRDIQFHWQNPPQLRQWHTFADFLGSLQAKKRKNILQERAKVTHRIVRKTGAELDDSDWRRIHALYQQTFDAKANTPALTEAFFLALGARQPEQVMAVLALDDAEQIVAMALFLHSDTHLYGRYWGAAIDVPGLHFECCYYQGIEFCLARGLTYFEPGAQGEHKLARGFLPSWVYSAHYIADPRFRTAIAGFLQAESVQRQAYFESLTQHSPFR